MVSVRRGFNGLRSTASAVRSAFCELQRWRCVKAHPTLEIEGGPLPHWGAKHLLVTIRNTGGRAAKDCRYCRCHVVSMSAAPGDGSASHAVAWYLSDAFNIPAEGTFTVQGHVSADECARAVLDDLVVDGGYGSSSIVAVTCR